MDELSSKKKEKEEEEEKKQSRREEFIYTQRHGQDWGLHEGDGEWRTTRLIMLPAEAQETSPGFLQGSCHDVVPWWEKKKCWEDEQRERENRIRPRIVN